MEYEQGRRTIGVMTPLGGNELVLTGFHGVEALSRPFNLSVGMLSENTEIDPRDIVGENVTVTLLEAEGRERHFNGDVADFTNHGTGDRGTTYTATVVPRLAFLQHRSDCRIFQNLTVPDVIEEVLAGAGLSEYEVSGLSGSYPRMEYCVQYRETDFAFISRLMEREGIFYAFRHEAGRHVLVLGDHAGAYLEQPDDEVSYTGSESAVHIGDRILDWRHRYRFTSGRVATADFDFERPASPVRSREQTVLELAGMKDFEQYEYPGGRTDDESAAQLARIRMEQIEAGHDFVEGSSRCAGFSPGHRFRVADHQHPSEEGREWVLLEVRHRVQPGGYVSGADAPEGYENEFLCVPADLTWRPPRETPSASVSGPQTAIVTGPDGEEIHTDEHGRIKVKFHWDRSDVVDDRASCWIRVAQGWAGRRWGGVFLPRVGQEVLVEFLEGDPDRPLVTGSIYNGDNRTPYELPASKTLSGIKSSSSKGSNGFNEIRFEDKAGEEQVFVHAQKNLDLRVQQHRFETVQGDRHQIVEGSRLDRVGVDRSATIGQDDVRDVKRDHHLAVGGKEAIEISTSRSLKVGADLVEVVGGSRTADVTGSMYLKAAGVVIEATSGITLKCGGSSLVLNASGVTVKGPTVVLDGAMVRIASGPGSPPTPGMPGQLVAPVAPPEPEEADVSDPGKVSEIKARQREERTGKYGSTPPPVFVAGAGEDGDEGPKSWIEVELVDGEDKPIAGERFELQLPDGETVYRGTTDANGIARVEGIDPGQCSITFPDLDEEAWEPA